MVDEHHQKEAKMSEHSCHSNNEDKSKNQHGNEQEQGHKKHSPSCCDTSHSKPDYLLWVSGIIVSVLYLQIGFFEQTATFADWYQTLSTSVYELMNTIWIGIVLGILMVALLSKIPREFVMSILGTNNGFTGILRATAAGVLLDLCSHGILMVGAKLYERGASIGQVMAFLVASPWNSFSLTLVLITLVGFSWTLAFILLSMVIAIVVGVVFDALVKNGTLPGNKNDTKLPADFQFWPEAKKQFSAVNFSATFFKEMVLSGIKESRMVVRWILFGVLLAGLIRAFVSPEHFGTYFGPTLAGLGLTVLVATIIEVCSEGSTPIAADLLTRAKAPGNSFAFLMTGVSTDYTEIMVLKETTKSWKIALFLPLITVPQVILIAWVMNAFTT